jgi:hypothetical protein
MVSCWFLVILMAASSENLIQACITSKLFKEPDEENLYSSNSTVDSTGH